MEREELEQVLGRKMRPGVRNDPRILVDPEDAWLLGWKWTIHQSKDDNGHPYARRTTGSNDKRTVIFLHRVILNAPDGVEVDHINLNGLDNRRENLRLATGTQNMAHRGLQSNNTSGRKGVYWHRARNKWHAQIGVAGKYLFLGYFADLDEATRAYDRAALKYHGEFALTNEMLAK